MKLARKPGATSEIWQIFIEDSSSTTGAPLTGLTSGSSGLTCYFHRDNDTTPTAISLTTMTLGTFTSGGFAEIDSTNMPGWYQFCPTNASITTGAKSCGFHLKGATNMAPLPIEVDLGAQVDVTQWNSSTTPVSNINTIFNTDYASIYDTTNKAFTSKLGNFAMGGSSLALTTGAISSTSVTFSGAVAFQSTFAITGNLSVANGVTLTRSGSGNCVSITGGTGSGAHGISVTGGGTGGIAALFTATGDNPGVKMIGITGGAGINCQGGTSGPAGYFNGGVDGIACQAAGVGSAFALHSSGSGPAVYIANDSTGPAVQLQGGTSGGANAWGFQCDGGANRGAAIFRAGASATEAVVIVGITTSGANTGVKLNAGLTGTAGLHILGGATSGVAVQIATTSGNAVNIAPTAGHGIVSTGQGTSKHGALLTGSDTGTGDGFKCVAGVSGVGARLGSLAVTSTTVLSGTVTATDSGNDIRGISLVDGTITTNTFGGGATIPRCTLVDTTTTNTDMLTAVAVFSAQMTEGYAAAGAAQTLQQAIFEILAHLGQASIVGTVKTIKKRDGSTPAKTYNLNSATVPTSIAEAT